MAPIKVYVNVMCKRRKSPDDQDKLLHNTQLESLQSQIVARYYCDRVVPAIGKPVFNFHAMFIGITC